MQLFNKTIKKCKNLPWIMDIMCNVLCPNTIIDKYPRHRYEN